jgi:type I restriction enzyme, S subunit
VSIPVPSVEEQWRIVNFLDAETARLDLLHKARERQRAALLQRSQVELEEFMATEIKKYGKVALRRAAWRIEQGWSPQCDDHLAAPDEWGVLKTSAVSSGNFNAMAHKKLPSSMEPDIRYIVEDGDLLLTRGSGSAELVGMAAVAETGGRKLLLSDLLYRVSLNPQWSTKFVAFALRSPQARQQVLLAVRGASGLTVKIRTEDILGITVPATPGSMQREIARELNRRALEYSRLIEVISCSNELIAERRNALIAAAVTGQFEVTTGAGADLS